MLSIRVNNQSLDLGDDISISWELRNPMFYEAGSRSFPFHIKNTPRNQKTLGYRHRIEGALSVYDEFPCSIVFRKIDLFRGTLKFKTLNKDYIEAVVYLMEGDFNYNCKSKLLTDFDFGDYSYATPQAGVDYVNHIIYDLLPQYWGYPNFNRAYPMINNENYFDPPTEYDILKYFNYRLEAPYYLSLYSNHDDPEPNNIIVPFVYLRHVLNTVISALGYAFTDLLFTTHPDFSKLIIYNSLSNNNHCPNFTYSMDKTFLNLHLPRISLTEFLSGIEQLFNARFYVDDLDKKITLQPLDALITAGDDTVFDQGVISNTIEPDEQIKGFHLSMELDSSDQELSSAADLSGYYDKHLKASVDTVADLPAWPFSMPEDVRYVVARGTFYRFLTSKTWIEDAMVQLSKFGDYFHKEFGEVNTIKVSSLMNNAVIFSNTMFSKCGNQLADYSDIKFRLLFVDSIAVPNTTPTKYIPIGTMATANHNLWMNFPNNMFDKFHRKTCDFYLTTKMVKIQKDMSFTEIRNFDFKKKYRIDSTRYLIRRIQLTIKGNSITPALMECMTVK